jgi:hypothetical protein
VLLTAVYTTSSAVYSIHVYIAAQDRGLCSGAALAFTINAVITLLYAVYIRLQVVTVRK